MPDTTVPARITPVYRAPTATWFYALAEVPPELEWFKNILPGEMTGLEAAARIIDAGWKEEMNAGARYCGRRRLVGP